MLTFPGKSRFEIPHHQTLDPANGLTLELWAYRVGGGNCKLAGKVDLYQNSSGYLLGLYDEQLYCEAWNGKNSGEIRTGFVPEQRWTHLALVLDSRRGMQAFVNGVCVQSEPQFFYKRTRSENTLPFVLGAAPWDSSTVYFPFHGALADVRLWGKALLPTQLQQAFGRRKTAFDASLLAHWHRENPDGVIDECQRHHGKRIDDPRYEWPALPERKARKTLHELQTRHPSESAQELWEQLLPSSFTEFRERSFDEGSHQRHLPTERETVFSLSVDLRSILAAEALALEAAARLAPWGEAPVQSFCWRTWAETLWTENVFSAPTSASKATQALCRELSIDDQTTTLAQAREQFAQIDTRPNPFEPLTELEQLGFPLLKLDDGVATMLLPDGVFENP